jgi:D-glycerate 3-kinase
LIHFTISAGFLSCPDHSPTAFPPRTGQQSPAPARASSSSPALVSSVQDLYEFICSGPLVDKIGYNKEKIAENVDRWLAAGGHVARLFHLNELQLSEAEKTRIYHFYIPVFLWCEDQIIERRAKYNEGDDIPPLVVRTRIDVCSLDALPVRWKLATKFITKSSVVWPV